MQHSGKLLELARNIQLEGTDPADISQWVKANLDLLGTWWIEQKFPNGRNLDVLVGRLEPFCREVAELRRRLPS
jgi:hypothetical protein